MATTEGPKPGHGDLSDEPHSVIIGECVGCVLLNMGVDRMLDHDLKRRNAIGRRAISNLSRLSVDYSWLTPRAGPSAAVS
jgi:hypothetical protein